MALLFGMLAYNANIQSLEGVTSLVNYIFGCMAYAMLLPYVSISLYTSDKKTYLADASAKHYRASAYYIAKVRRGRKRFASVTALFCGTRVCHALCSRAMSSHGVCVVQQTASLTCVAMPPTKKKATV